MGGGAQESLDGGREGGDSCWLSHPGPGPTSCPTCLPHQAVTRSHAALFLAPSQHPALGSLEPPSHPEEPSDLRAGAACSHLPAPVH